MPDVSTMCGNSLAAYPTSRTVLRGLEGSNALRLPDPAQGLVRAVPQNQFRRVRHLYTGNP